jgi:hypothetical protein
MAKKQGSVQTRSTSAADHDAAPEPGAKIEIGAKNYAVGDAVTIDGSEFVAEAILQLPASSTSGVSAGTYAVVSEMQGNRKAYRAVVDGRLYPVRQYGTPNQVIAKQRESHKGATKAARAPRGQAARTSDDGISLGSIAADILSDYLALAPPGADRGDIMSELVVKHLGPEVERLRSAQAAIAKLPRDLLIALANATEEKRLELMAALLK